MKGRGKGGSLKRAAAASGDGVAGHRPELVLESQEPGQEPSPRPAARKGAGTARAKRTGAAGAPNVLAYRHDQRRVNNPEVGMVGPESDPAVAETVWRYRTLVLEIKGVDSEQNKAKRDALDLWVRGVNAHGGFGVWCWDVAFEMAQIRDILARHAA